MDSKHYPELQGEQDHSIDLQSGGKRTVGNHQRQQRPQGRQRRPSSVLKILLTVLVLGLVILGVSTPKSAALWWKMPCHDRVVAEQEMEVASTEALRDSLPGRHRHEMVESDHLQNAAGRVESNFRRISRRQSNSTTSAAPPPPTTSSSTSTPPPPPPSTTTPPPPPVSAATVSASPTSSSTTTSPPPPPASSTTPPPPPASTTTPPPPPPPPPSSSSSSSSRPQLTTIPGTTLTRLTTLARGSDVTVMEVPVTVPPQTSQLVLTTLTSTRPNGQLVVVTQTSYVPPDPAVTGEGYSSNEPSLHNGASGKGIGGVAVAVMVGAMVGGVML